jgi:hypothetical protein
MKVQTRIGIGRRIWVCPVCGWRATISTRKHVQTGQSLTREQQIGSLAVDAECHFRERHRGEFLRPRSTGSVTHDGEPGAARMLR